MRRTSTFDMPLFVCVLILVGLGIAFIYSASYPKAMVLPEAHGDSFYFAAKQIKLALIGLVVLLACAHFPLRLLYRHPSAKIAYWVNIGGHLLLLICVLIFADDRHGNRSWLGPIQPSEFAKVGVIIALATYLVWHPWATKTLKAVGKGPLIFLLGTVGLIGLQKDLGTASVVACSLLVMLLIAGVRFVWVAVPGAVIICLMAFFVLSGHRAGRIDAWQDPLNEANPASYQVRNSLIAVGSGGMMGRGFCQSRQKWFYLPAAQNDSILAIVAEELGFARLVLFVLFPYMILIYRGFTIAHRAPDEFGALVAAGCTTMLATQALINMAVVTNVIPSMGINLPFISYGGSSLVASMAMAGLLLNVSAMRPAHEAQQAPVAATAS
jgi:cell division protein FtsW